MTVEYTKRAVADLRRIAAYCEGLGIAGLGDRIAARFDEVIVLIVIRPQSGRQVPTRPGARVASVLRYPYLIYYEIPSQASFEFCIFATRHSCRGRVNRQK
jgi:plasmid stabilization system protein ParE